MNTNDSIEEVRSAYYHNELLFPVEYRIGVEHYSASEHVVSIGDARTQRMLERHSTDGYIVFSPFVGTVSMPNEASADEVNQISLCRREVAKSFCKDLYREGLTYSPVYGGFVENIGAANECHIYESAFIIYNRTRDRASYGIEHLCAYGRQMLQKHSQSSFLLKTPDRPPQYISLQGEGNLPFDSQAKFCDFAREYFIHLHQERHGSPLDTSVLFLDSYVNPPSGSISSRMPRAAKGEVFIY